MSPEGSGRERILGRIREALEGREPAPHPGRFPGTPPAELGGVSGRVEAFAASFREAGGEVVLLADEDAAKAWLDELAGEHGTASVADDVPPALRPAIAAAAPDEAALGVSRARGAAADTGTLLLGSGGGRAVQLLPPVHLVWVDASDVHASLDEALERAGAAGLPPALGLHSGPSKSADIGRIVVTGVHGPGRVVAAVVGSRRGSDAAGAER